MRWAACALLGAVGCVSEHAMARAAITDVIDDQRGLATAIAEADAKALRAMMVAGVADGGLWFDDAACRTRFAAPRLVPEAELDDFARCLAGLHLHPAANVHRIPDVAVLDYDPGVEVEAEVLTGARRQQLVSIGFLGSVDARGWLPAISADALESLRVAGSRDDHDAAARALLDAEVARSPDRSVVAVWHVCIGRDGAVTSATMYDGSGAGGLVLGRAIARWRFRPFLLGGVAMPACTQVTLSYPREPIPRTWAFSIPLLDPATEGVGLGKRIEGDAQITPLDSIKMRIVAGSHFVTVIRFCTDETGRVATVKVYEPSGLPSYDDQLVQAIKRWRYAPTIVDGHALPACGATVFVYTQH